MLFRIKYLLPVLLVMVCTSCSMQKTMPFYTEPVKIATLHSGMTMNEVNTHLGIEPHDYYYAHGTESAVVTYKYRLKKRALAQKAATPATDENLHSSSGQTSGKVHYEEEKTLYVYLVDGKVRSLLTEDGRADSKAVLVTNNALKLISEKDLVDYEERAQLYHEGQVVVFNRHNRTAENRQLRQEPAPKRVQVAEDPVESPAPRPEPGERLLIEESFYEQLPVGRADLHPRNPETFPATPFPGQNVSVPGAFIAVATIGLSRLFVPASNKRVGIFQSEVMRRALLLKAKNLQEKGRLTERRRQRLAKQVRNTEQKIIRNYNKLNRMDARFDEPGGVKSVLSSPYGEF